MKIQAAAISLQGVNFAIAVVDMDLLNTHGEADMAIERISPSFAGVPVVTGIRCLLHSQDFALPQEYFPGTGTANLLQDCRQFCLFRQRHRQQTSLRQRLGR